jgi:hypothetical protein
MSTPWTLRRGYSACLRPLNSNLHKPDNTDYMNDCSYIPSLLLKSDSSFLQSYYDMRLLTMNQNFSCRISKRPYSVNTILTSWVALYIERWFRLVVWNFRICQLKRVRMVSSVTCTLHVSSHIHVDFVAWLVIWWLDMQLSLCSSWLLFSLPASFHFHSDKDENCPVCSFVSNLSLWLPSWFISWPWRWRQEVLLKCR